MPNRTPRQSQLNEWCSAIGWTAVGTWISQLLLWAASLVTARLLTPDDYGLIGMTTLLLGFMSLLADAGIGATVVNLQDLSSSAVSQMHSVSAAVGGVSSLLVCGGGVLAAEFFGRAELRLLFCVMSIPVFLSGLRAVPSAVLQRQRRFRELSILEAVRAVIQSSVALGFAWAGWRYWSLAIGAVVAAAVSAGLYNWRANPGMCRPGYCVIKVLRSFSVPLLLSNLGWFVHSNADFVVAGKRLGATALGCYSFAWNISAITTEKIAVVIGKVVPAFMSREDGNTEGIRRQLCGISKALALVTCPFAVVMAACAEALIPMVVGPRWSGSVALIKILSLYMPFAALFGVVAQAAISCGRPKWAMSSSLVKAVLMPVGFYCGSRVAGARGIALVWLLIGVPSTLPLCIAVFRRVGLAWQTYVRSIASALAGSASMFLAISGSHGDGVVRLAISLIAGVAVYTTVVVVFEQAAMRHVLVLAAAARNRMLV